MAKIISFEGGDCSGKGTQIKLLQNYLEEKGHKVWGSLYEPGSTNKADIIRTVLKNRPDTERLNLNFQKTFDFKTHRQIFEYEQVPPIAEFFIHHALETMQTGLKTEMLEFLINNSLPEKSIVEATLSNITKNPKGTEFCEKYLSKEVLTAQEQAYLFLASRNMVYNAILENANNFEYILLDRSKDSTVIYQGHAQNPHTIPILRGYNNMATEGIPLDITILLDLPTEEVIRRRAKRKGQTPDFFDNKANTFHERVKQGYLHEQKYYESLPKNHPESRRIVCIHGTGSPKEIHKNILYALAERKLIE
ncbi:MAG: dTMP kinase [Candidatus Woesearchaeota archaeon]